MAGRALISVIPYLMINMGYLRAKNTSSYTIDRNGGSDMRPRRCRLELLLLFASTLLPAHAFSQTAFYEGKTITFVNATEPGGTGDLRARALVPFLRKYIPGNPTIVTEYMPGAGSR